MPEEFFQVTGLPNGSGPDAQNVTIRLSDLPGSKYLEASISNFGGSNVHIASGNLNLAQCQQLLERGFTDILMTVPGTGVMRRRLPTNVGQLTVFFEGANNSGQFQLVNLKVIRLP